MAEENAVLMYKGRPLMRKDNLIYYGSMADSHIVMLQILESKKGGMNARRASKQAISYAQNMNTEVKAFTKKSATVEGTHVYKTKDGKLFAVTKNGTNYYLYYDGNISQPLSISKIIGARSLPKFSAIALNCSFTSSIALLS